MLVYTVAIIVNGPLFHHRERVLQTPHNAAGDSSHLRCIIVWFTDPFLCDGKGDW